MAAGNRLIQTALLASLMIHGMVALLAQRWPWKPISTISPPQPLTVILRPEARPSTRPRIPSLPVRHIAPPRPAVRYAVPPGRHTDAPVPVETKPAVPAPEGPPLNDQGGSDQTTAAPVQAVSASGQNVPTTLRAGAAPPVSPPDILPSFDAAYLNNPVPGYPPVARRRGIEGTVQLEVLVGTQGQPRDVRVAHSSGSALLDDSALATVRGWRFLPARHGADAIEARVVVPVRFSLSQPDR